MGIYGNVFKPVAPPSQEAIRLLEDANNAFLQEAEELSVFSEARFHLFKIGDDAEYKRFKKDLSDADQILNANSESIDVNKVGHALLHGTDKIVSAINAGTSIGAIVNIFLLPVALISKLASVALKTGKEKEALAYAEEAIDKLEAIRDTSENPTEQERIQRCIDKLENSKHALEVGRKNVRKEEKAVKKEKKVMHKLEKKEAREEKRALKKAARDLKKNKDVNANDDEDDSEAISQLETTEFVHDFLDLCIEQGFDRNQIVDIMEIVSEDVDMERDLFSEFIDICEDCNLSTSQVEDILAVLGEDAEETAFDKFLNICENYDLSTDQVEDILAVVGESTEEDEDPNYTINSYEEFMEACLDSGEYYTASEIAMVRNYFGA